jgi:hypothetical protein
MQLLDPRLTLFLLLCLIPSCQKDLLGSASYSAPKTDAIAPPYEKGQKSLQRLICQGSQSNILVKLELVLRTVSNILSECLTSIKSSVSVWPAGILMMSFLSRLDLLVPCTFASQSINLKMVASFNNYLFDKKK